MRSPVSRVRTQRALPQVTMAARGASVAANREAAKNARLGADVASSVTCRLPPLSLRLRRVPRGPPAPGPAPPAPAPRHRAHQPPTAAGVRLGGAQEEAVAVLAHLPQAHPIQEVSAGPPSRRGGHNRGQGLFVSSVPGPRTVWGTLCRRPLSGTVKGEGRGLAFSLRRCSRPLGSGEAATTQLQWTREPSAACARWPRPGDQ